MGANILSVRIVEGEDEARLAHEAKMRDVAKAVSGIDDPNPWLAKLLVNWSFEIRSSHSVESMLLTKGDQRRALSEIHASTARLLELQRLCVQQDLNLQTEIAKPSPRPS